ncbi:MAG: hypothetical protein U1A77_02690 [Pirellulales bacterium]
MCTPLSNVTFAFALSALMLATDEPSKSDKAPLDFRQLVAQLASPNEAPNINNRRAPKTNNRREPRVTFPSSYDREAQEKALAARQLLYDNFADALPELIASIDDQRYSITISWADGEEYYNQEVGAVCKNVIASQLEVYRAKIRFLGPGHWHKYTYPVSKEWWEKHKDKSHRQLQIIAIDWAIEERKKEKGIDGDDRNNELTELIKLREQLALSDKPLDGRSMYRTVTQDK